MASRVDERVHARRRLGEKRGELRDERRDELAVAELSDQADDRVGRPRHQPDEDDAEAEAGDTDLVQRVLGQLEENKVILLTDGEGHI